MRSMVFLDSKHLSYFFLVLLWPSEAAEKQAEAEASWRSLVLHTAECGSAVLSAAAGFLCSFIMLRNFSLAVQRYDAESGS